MSAARKREAWIGATVIVEINDEDVIRRVTGPDGDECWADLRDDAATMYVDRDTLDVDVQPGIGIEREATER